MFHKRIAMAALVALLSVRSVSAQQFCPADTDADLMVNIDDLLNVLSAWGPLPPGLITHPDVTSDGVVDVDDLLAVITAWGPCSPTFEIDAALVDGGSGGSTDGAFAWCSYRVDSSNPGSALVPGMILCTSCPLTWMNSCPHLANATFKGVPGAPAAMSTGVNATPLGSGFCQDCPSQAGGRKYHRTG